MNVLRKVSKPILAVSLLTAVIVSCAYIPGLRPRDFLLRKWNDEFTSLKTNEAKDRMVEAIAFGEDGLPLIVKGLRSNRQSVSHAAGELLFEELRSWKQLNDRAASRRVAVLAKLLADRPETFTPTARLVVTDLAARILIWPIDRREVDALQVVDNCEKVLRSAWLKRAVTSRQSSGTSADDSRPEWAVQQPATPRGVFTTQATIIQPDTGNSAPGGDLPLELTNISPLQPIEPIPTSNLEDREPRLLPSELMAPQRIDTSTRLPAEVDPGTASRAPYYRIQPRALMANLGDKDVMSYLHDMDDRTRESAQHELRRRGFSEVHLDLARKLTNSNPLVRRDLARDLTSMNEIEPREWLLELSRDTNRIVRLAATTVMATSTDPILRRRLLELELEETDEEILREVKRVLRGPSDLRFR